MKKTMKLLAMVLMVTSLVALGACTEKENPQPTPTETNDPEPEPEPDPEPEPGTGYETSTTFAVHYDGMAVAAGDTVFYHISPADVENDWVKIDFVMENLTGEPVGTTVRINWQEGVQSMKTLDGVCTNVCLQDQTCPFNSDVFTLNSGLNQLTPLSIEFKPSNHATDAWATYKVTVGKGSRRTDPQVFFLKVDLNQSTM